MKKCPYCLNECHDEAVRCISCGEPLPSLYTEFNYYYENIWKDFHNFVNKAEENFTDLMKLLITLSTVMIVFLVTIKDKLFANISEKIMVIFLTNIAFSILFAIVTLILISFHYAQYANRLKSDSVDIYKKWKNKEFEKVQERIDSSTLKFEKSKGGAWQYDTIICGTISIIGFLVSITLVIIFLLTLLGAQT